MAHLHLFSFLILSCILIISPTTSSPYSQENVYNQYSYHDYEIPTTHVLPNIPHASIPANVRRLSEEEATDESIRAIPIEKHPSTPSHTTPAVELLPAQELHFPYPPPPAGLPYHYRPPFNAPFNPDMMMHHHHEGHQEGHRGGRRGPGGKFPKLELETMSAEDIEALLDRSIVNMNEAITNIEPRNFWMNAGKIGQVLRYRKRMAELETIDTIEKESSSSSPSIGNTETQLPPASSRRRLQYNNYGNNYGYGGRNQPRYGGYGNNNNRYGNSPYSNNRPYGGRSNNNGYNNNGYNNGRRGNVCCYQCRTGDVQCLTNCERIC